MARIAAVLVVFALLVPAARADDEVVARLGAPTPVAALDGWLAYSTRDGAEGPWRLQLRGPDGAVAAAAVPPRAEGPFDVDLGPDVDGGLVATYSRAGVPYLYDVAARSERRLAAIDAPRAAETWPSAWRGRVAFQRTYESRPGYPYLYASRYDRAVRSTRMPGGPRNACVRNRSTRRLDCSPRTSSRATSIELTGTRMAFAWTYMGLEEGLRTEIRLDTIGGGHERVAEQGGGGLTQVTLGWPGIAEGRLYWTKGCQGDPGGCPGNHLLLRRRILRGPVDSLVGPVSVLSHDRDAHADYVLTDTGGVGDCQSDPPTGEPTCELRRIAYPGSP